MTDPVARKGLLLKADPIAAAFHDEVKQSLDQCRIRPKLVGILATSSAPSKNYAEYTRKQCEDLGVEFVLIQTGASVSPDLGEGYGVEEAIIAANEDDSVHGIMVNPFYSSNLWFGYSLRFKVYYPIFGAQQVGTHSKRHSTVMAYRNVFRITIYNRYVTAKFFRMYTDISFK